MNNKIKINKKDFFLVREVQGRRSGFAGVAVLE
jgi:hypothetical protein